MDESGSVQRTREAIRQAFLTLLDEKPLERIAAKEVADAAATSRTTFYRYYKDVYDLLNDCYLAYCIGPFEPFPLEADAEEFARALHEGAVAGAKRVRMYRNLFLMCLDVRDLVFDRAFEGSVILQAQDVAERQAENLGLTDENSLLPVPVVARLCVDLQTNLFASWAKAGCVETPEDIARAINQACKALILSQRRDWEL